MASGQSMVIMIVFVIMIFGGLAVFLLSISQTVSQKEYHNLYVHNLLLSVMRTDTGYTDPNCKLVSDTLGCAFTQSTEYKCGGSGEPCIELANGTLTNYMDRFELVKKNFRYLFIAKPETGVRIDPETGEPLVVRIGDKSLETARIDKLKTVYIIPKFLATGPYNIVVELFLAEK